ncbi:DUF4136 domain-containing protein [Bordetella avium]|uniref:DUF4136 domain-containing protein n=1 Tax=Bordetella avium TaxID=521 RepID=UPI000E683A28|nr:DUF4136 domain-containing protein [Bordetella avium]AZY50965.1 DUF4136 domain-containing protein [Bordetella avium]AZY54364.1 DUF4136 domain-containing protein [Bordetella avium]RIQ17774.1 DUF4136 domain-containing protein [Bordetella avium]RIQ32432.1 DUF4136 domain-containing protein [Bordetella avium]RIQ51132.1 DUF4136 domain-containing protein [Bordetella avium]
MALPRMLSVLGLAALLSACASGPMVRSDYDHQVNFAQYRSFAFMSPLGTDTAGYTNLLTERLKNAARLQMEDRGYVYDAQKPDLLVNFGAKLQNKLLVTPAAPPAVWPYYGYRTGFYGPWQGYGWGDDVYQYTEGTLNVDLIDPRLRQLVWEGVAVGEVNNPQGTPSVELIQKVMGQIFSQYPFRAGVGRPAMPKQP